MGLILYLMIRLMIFSVYAMAIGIVVFFAAVAFTIAGMIDIFYAIRRRRRVRWAYTGAVVDGARAIPQARWSDRR